MANAEWNAMSCQWEHGGGKALPPSRPAWQHLRLAWLRGPLQIALQKRASWQIRQRLSIGQQASEKHAAEPHAPRDLVAKMLSLQIRYCRGPRYADLRSALSYHPSDIKDLKPQLKLWS